jgi:hypothetical protein
MEFSFIIIIIIVIIIIIIIITINIPNVYNLSGLENMIGLLPITTELRV